MSHEGFPFLPPMFPMPKMNTTPTMTRAIAVRQLTKRQLDNISTS
ncbi:MAG TPA: hypothetical protein VN793_01580 [Acidimicrobiales bacterium]|nr:hypothetical protein [Acidimicrobiales bacterium]